MDKVNNNNNSNLNHFSAQADGSITALEKRKLFWCFKKGICHAIQSDEPQSANADIYAELDIAFICTSYMQKETLIT